MVSRNKHSVARTSGRHSETTPRRASTSVRRPVGGEGASGRGAAPMVERDESVIQQYGEITVLPIGLDRDVCAASASDLNQILADTMALRDMYKKHHWQVTGPTFYSLHLLFDKHYAEQATLVDELAERIQVLGGISIAMAADVAEETRIPRPPRGREEVAVQIARLLQAHELILTAAREMASAASERGDEGTNDLLVSDVVRRNELQVWFLAEHLVPGEGR